MDEDRLSYCKQLFDDIVNKQYDISETNLSVWREYKDSISRRFNLFKSDKLFIVTTGMLKAGKSTFINLLCRNENASPIGFGVDTTLRPALIKMSNDPSSRGGIYIYKQKNIADNESNTAIKKQMEQIIDGFKGLNEPEIVQPIELTQENLRKALCECAGTNPIIDQEPVLVVIEVPYKEESKIFSENCILFDMPGLDSADAEFSKHIEWYNAVFRECDLVLFLQSSVAPINEKACNYLSTIGKERSECTYRLVQNRMNSKYWLKDEVIKEELADQASKGIKNFIKKLNNSRVNEQSLKTWTVNLGMAYDSIFNVNKIDRERHTEDQLFAESEYSEMEKNLLDDIQRNGKEQRKAHCVDGLLTEIGEISGDKISCLIEKLQNKENENISERNEKNRKLSDLEKLSSYGFDSAGLELRVAEEIEDRLKSEFKTIFKNVKKLPAYEKVMPEYADGYKIKGSLYENYLKECSQKCLDNLKNLFSKVYVDDIYSGNEDCLKLINKQIDKLNEKIETINAKSKFLGDIEDKYSILEQYKIKPKKKNIWILPFEGKIEINQSSIDEEYSELCNHYISVLQKIIKNYGPDNLSSIMNNHVSTALSTQKELLENQINKLDDDISRIRLDKKSFSDIAMELDNLKKKISELDNM